MGSAIQIDHGTNQAVGVTAVPLYTCPIGVKKSIVKIRNNHATNTIYIGGANVSNSGNVQGLPILPNSADNFEFTSGTVIYVVASASPTSVSFIWSAGN